MFTSEERARLRSDLLEYATRDGRISGAAITGSAADSREDEWSDVDLAFGISVDADLQAVIFDWTAHLYDRHLALHHLDVLSGSWTYRVFLLPNSLQVDLAFVLETEFRALAPTFRLMFGKANEPRHSSPPSTETIIGMAWLYALHVRSSIRRQKLWQAEYMISGLREHALALACIRHGLPAVHAAGIDMLPSTVTESFAECLVQGLDANELSRAFAAVVRALVEQIRSIDEDLALRLEETLARLSDTDQTLDSAHPSS